MPNHTNRLIRRKILTPVYRGLDSLTKPVERHFGSLVGILDTTLKPVQSAMGMMCKTIGADLYTTMERDGMYLRTVWGYDQGEVIADVTDPTFAQLILGTYRADKSPMALTDIPFRYLGLAEHPNTHVLNGQLLALKNIDPQDVLTTDMIRYLFLYPRVAEKLSEPDRGGVYRQL